MALPVSPDPTDRRAAVLRMLEASPDGLSDAALAQALGDGTRPQTVNQLCRRLVAEGALERVGTRPILNRLPAPPARRRGRKTTAAPSAPDSTPGAHGAACARDRPWRREGHAADEWPARPRTSPPRAGRFGNRSNSREPSRPRRDDPERNALEERPHDRRRHDPRAGCFENRSISRDGTGPGDDPTARSGTRSKSGRRPPTSDAAMLRKPKRLPRGKRPPSRRARPPRRRKPKRRTQSTAESAAPEADAVQAEPAPEVVTPTTSQRETEAPTCGPPPFDALQAWSRVANVQALVADWLVRRGATLRSATLDGQGPTRDLVASLDGDDVHVEVTGWPADGARTHPTTIAGDWFSGAEQAAAQRRRAHPKARIVIALPDTRRYRSLTEQRATSLAGARAEVWFVDPAGSVQAR